MGPEFVNPGPVRRPSTRGLALTRWITAVTEVVSYDGSAGAYCLKDRAGEERRAEPLGKWVKRTYRGRRCVYKKDPDIQECAW